jgi:hypothetical protein
VLEAFGKGPMDRPLVAQVVGSNNERSSRLKAGWDNLGAVVKGGVGFC